MTIHDPVLDELTDPEEPVCAECGLHVDTVLVHAGYRDDRARSFAIEVRAPAGADEDVYQELEAIFEVQAELLRRVVREQLGEALEVIQWDPAHPDEDDDCQCSGPDGWHCEGEDGQHWAKSDGSCGYCGWEPAP